MKHLYKISIAGKERTLSTRDRYHFERITPIRQVTGTVTPGVLVLEGGAFRGLYTSGVCDALMEAGIHLATTVGVSAGALNGVNYACGMIGRSFVTNLNHRRDSRYVGFRAMLRSHGIIGFDFLFQELAERYPLPEGMLIPEGRRLVAVVTDRDTGKPAFLTPENCSDMTKALVASASLPLASRPVSLDGHTYLDGGCSLNIPVEWALEQGHEKVVAVLTRDRAYRRKETQGRSARAVQAAYYRRRPEMKEAARRSPERYNEERARIFRLEEEGRIFVIAPSEPVTVGRFESNLDALVALYRMGYRDAEASLDRLRAYLDS